MTVTAGARARIVCLWLLIDAPTSVARAQAPDIVEQIEESPPPAASDQDLVEQIDAEPSSVASTPAPGVSTPAAVPPTVDRIELHGWVRQSVELGFARNVAREGRPDPFALPYDQLISRSQLLVRARYMHDRWLEVNASGFLSYGLFEQGTRDPDSVFNGFNGQTWRGAVDPQLRELYIGVFSRRLDLRVGQQRIAWGRGELISPNDVLNARDSRDPLVGEAELRALPTLLVRADLDVEIGSLQVVFAPLFTPDRFDVFGANWAGLQPSAPREVRGLFNMLSREVDPGVRDPLQRFLAGTKLPSGTLTEPLWGARFSWSAGNFDVSHYYHFGFDGPYIDLDPRLLAALTATDFRRAGLQDLQPLLMLIDAGEEPVRITYLRRHHVGVDATTIVGPFALRVDAAYQSRRVLFRRDLQGTTSPSLQVVAALEYQTGETDKLLLFEAMYMRFLRTPEAPLLIWEQDSLGVAGLLRWSLFGPVGVELRAMFGIRPVTQVVQPQLDVKLQNWTLSLGGLWLHGEDYSFGGYFQRNTEVYLKAKGAF